MTESDTHIPNLEERFLQPKGWRAHHFESHGMRITFGSVFPEDSVPDAVVVCLPGLSEFTEKYYEVARTCLDMNLAFWVLDWPGQGRSDRYVKGTQKRHSQNFDIEVERLHDFILSYIKHSSVHPDVGRIPLAMLGHSMGANIGLRYLEKYPDTFECAAFSAPMFGIKRLNGVPFAGALLSILNIIMPKAFIYGGGNWHKRTREKSNDAHIFSHDPIRADVHDAWCDADPSLAIGSPTYGWLHHAAKSCRKIKSKQFLSHIKTECLITIAGKESIVDNFDAAHVASHLEHAHMLEFQDAAHEILMEKDDIRNKFFDEFKKLIQKTIIDKPETLKPF
ncbi:MAG: alpha/beta hydrolase [Alphaproteobacteria bacterium]|nr:alpha/beta hydrolase [Alphaproteobacteria bacterium]